MRISLKAWINEWISRFRELVNTGGVLWSNAQRRRLKPIRKRQLCFESLQPRQMLAANVWLGDAMTVNEGAGTVSVEVHASEVSNSATVNFSTVDGTAQPARTLPALSAA